VTTAPSDKAEGIWVWVSYRFTPLWSVFTRWDEAKTSQDLAPNRKDEYYNAGVAVQPHSKLQFALAYKHEKVDGGGLVNTAYGNLGGTLEGTVSTTLVSLAALGLARTPAFQRLSDALS
jgi:hypothetical protein